MLCLMDDADKVSHTFRAGFLKLGTTDILSWLILCRGGYPVPVL